MTRDTSQDAIMDDLLQRYVLILSLLDGFGTFSDGSKAVYPELGMPFPQEPFPAAYCYLASQIPDLVEGTGFRRDINTVNVRIIGGPLTPGYAASMANPVPPERLVYQMVNAVRNELTHRRFLEDPTNNNAPFRLLSGEDKVSLSPTGRIQAFKYADQGEFAGIEIPTIVPLTFRIPRLS